MMTMADSKANEVGRPRLAYVVGVTAYIVVVTIKQSTTTDISYFVTGLVLIVAAAVVIACIVQLSMQQELSGRLFATSAMFLGLVIWATLGSMLNQSFYIASEVMLIDISVIGAGLFIFSKSVGKVLPDAFAKIFVVYVALASFMSLMTGGLILGFPPRFSFEYAYIHFGVEITYGQGASNFYGFGAIAAAFWLARSGNILEKVLAATLMALNMMLSVIGAARGDPALALLVITAYFTLRMPGKAALWITVAVLASIMLIKNWTWIENLVFVQRILSIGEGDYGYRDQLIAQVVGLLDLQPLCLVTGCGVGYFQHFYGYERGMSPHNSLLESLVIFGLPLTVTLMLLTLRGGVLYYRRVGEFDLFLLFTLYALGISLKSGSFFGSWLTLSGCLYLVSHCFLSRGKHAPRRHGGQSSSPQPGEPHPPAGRGNHAGVVSHTGNSGARDKESADWSRHVEVIRPAR